MTNRLPLWVVVLAIAGCSPAPPIAGSAIGNDLVFTNPPLGSTGLRGAGGIVTGRVVDERTQAGIPDALVEVVAVDPPIRTYTDVSGNFQLVNVPQNTQTIVVNKADYVYVATQGPVRAVVTANATLTLPLIVLSPTLTAVSNTYMASIGGVVEPYGLAVDSTRGHVYVVDRVGANNLVDRRCEIKKFNLAGGFLDRFGGDALDVFGHLNWSYGIDVDAGGNTYVAETNKDRVVKFGPDGEYLATFDDEVSIAYDVVLLNTNQLAVSSSGNSRIKLFEANKTDSSRDFAGTAGNLPVNGGLRGLAVDANNNLYVLDNAGGPGLAVRKYEAKTNKQILNFGSNDGTGPSEFKGASELAVDNRNGDIYVVDTGNNRVQRFDANGKFRGEFGSAGRGNGQFDRPYGIAIDKDGYVYVSDTGNKRIQKFAPGRMYNNPNALNNVYYPTK